jgi:hypothetical protein
MPKTPDRPLKFCPHRRAWISYFPDEIYVQSFQEALSWLSLKTRPTARVSRLLLHQLALHASRFGDIHRGQWHHFHFHQILDAISEIEGKADAPTTKPAKPFRRGPLKGLWHKHFSSPAFVAMNVLNAIRKNSEELLEIFEARRQQMSLKHDQESTKLTGLLAYTFALDGLRLRACASSGRSQITGEWIVFEKNVNTTTLLALATHDEGDRVIYERVVKARDELIHMSDFHTQ